MNRINISPHGWRALGLMLLEMALLLSAPAALAQTNQVVPSRRGRPANQEPGIYRARVTPHWFEHDTRFWYRNDLKGGGREFIAVDAIHGTRERAFDHEAVARQIGGGVLASHLPIERLRFGADSLILTLIGRSNSWTLDLKSGALQPLSGEPTPTGGLPAEAKPRPSSGNGPETQITFDNQLSHAVRLFWIDSNGSRQSYGTIPPATRRDQHTFGGHVWLVADEKGRTLAVYEASDDPAVALIDGSSTPRLQPKAAKSERAELPGRSPDGQWMAFVREGNVFFRGASAETNVVQLSQDGSKDNHYERLSWSPDSKTVISWRVEPGARKEVYLIRSSPPGGGRAILESRPYAQPGDTFPRHELNLFEVGSHRQIKPQVDRFEHEWETPSLHWSLDGRRFSYRQIDRGHQRFRVIEVELETGAIRNLVDERTDTFIWTAHTENLGLGIVNWLSKTDELLYVSERDGWRHLYLVDARNDASQNQITQGQWVVRAIDRIDEERRQIWFRASGLNSDQDPYFIHYYRINFDGSGLVALTQGNGEHSIQFSPDRTFLIDTWSRVDLAPINVLRRVGDGSEVCQLESADTSELEAAGWESPEVFVAKGRDGKTDIWGVICRPRNFAPGQKYPVLENIYAGPQSSYVQKSFSVRSRFASLTDRGFVVVQMDGMGTANRSKAFHDVCWKNLKDAGFPDRMLWHRAAAAKYSWYDLERVGIYGTSAGGQNAAGAVLFHPEFYKAAAAACGCHDNRLDKASWNEQWMGYPVGPQYSECSNIDNAYRLRGKLMLIVGEVDRNVPPESTLRFADALIQAGKDFDLVVVPGADHGMGGPYGQRRLEDFFVRHLLHQEPPDRNAKAE